MKTAQRIIVDLKDKIKTGSVVAGNAGTIGTLVSAANAQVQEEAVAALTMLGFAQAPSQKVVLAILNYPLLSLSSFQNEFSIRFLC